MPRNKYLFNDKELIKKITNYEKEFEKNAVEMLKEFRFNSLKEKEFKDLVLEYIRRNLNPLKINQYKITTFTPLNIVSHNKKEILNFLHQTTENDFLIMRNCVENYKDLLLITNSAFRYTILITDNKEDYELNFSNVCVIYAPDYDDAFKYFEGKSITE